MQNSFRWPSSHLLLPFLALALLAARPAKADTITVFDVSGSATNEFGGMLGSCAAGAACPFSGMLTVDVTSTTTNPLGAVDAVSITLPGLTVFDSVLGSDALGSSNWLIEAGNSSGVFLQLQFTTTPTPASLVGFTGGSIISVSAFPPSNPTIYFGNSGTITPVPEPSSLGMLAAGLLAFVGIVGLRRRKAVVTSQGVFRTP